MGSLPFDGLRAVWGMKMRELAPVSEGSTSSSRLRGPLTVSESTGMAAPCVAENFLASGGSNWRLDAVPGLHATWFIRLEGFDPR